MWSIQEVCVPIVQPSTCEDNIRFSQTWDNTSGENLSFLFPSTLTVHLRQTTLLPSTGQQHCMASSSPFGWMSRSFQGQPANMMQCVGESVTCDLTYAHTHPHTHSPTHPDPHPPTHLYSYFHLHSPQGKVGIIVRGYIHAGLRMTGCQVISENMWGIEMPSFPGHGKVKLQLKTDTFLDYAKMSYLIQCTRSTYTLECTNKVQRPKPLITDSRVWEKVHFVLRIMSYLSYDTSHQRKAHSISFSMQFKWP